MKSNSIGIVTLAGTREERTDVRSGIGDRGEDGKKNTMEMEWDGETQRLGVRGDVSSRVRQASAFYFC